MPADGSMMGNPIDFRMSDIRNQELTTVARPSAVPTEAPFNRVISSTILSLPRGTVLLNRPSHLRSLRFTASMFQNTSLRDALYGRATVEVGRSIDSIECRMLLNVVWIGKLILIRIVPVRGIIGVHLEHVCGHGRASGWDRFLFHLASVWLGVVGLDIVTILSCGIGPVVDGICQTSGWCVGSTGSLMVASSQFTGRRDRGSDCWTEREAQGIQTPPRFLWAIN